MIARLIITIFLLGTACLSYHASAQSTLEELTPIWSTNLGWPLDDEINDVIINRYSQIVTLGNIDLYSRGLEIAVRIVQDGKVTKLNNIGGKDNDVGLSIEETPTGYLIAGYTSTKWPEANGRQDGFIVMLDHNLSIQWTKVLGSQQDDQFYKIIPMAGYYTVVGSYAGFVTFIDITESGEILKNERTKQRGQFRDAILMKDGNIALLTTQGDGYRAKTSLSVYNSDYDQVKKEELSRKLVGQGKKLKLGPDNNIVFIGSDTWNKRSGSDAHITAYNLSSNEHVLLQAVSHEWDETIADFIINDDFIVTLGSTYSHKRNAKRSNNLMSIYDRKDQSSKDYHFGGNQDELISKALLTLNNDILIAGSIDQGGHSDGVIASLVNLPKRTEETNDFKLSLTNQSEVDEVFKTVYYPENLINVTLAIDQDANLPASVSMYLKGDGQCIEKNVLQSVNIQTTQVFSLPIHIEENCPPGTYDVEMGYVLNGQKIPLAKQRLTVKEKPYYEVELMSTDIVFDEQSELYKVDLKLKNKGNHTSQISPTLNIPDYVQLDSALPSSFNHELSNLESVAFDIAIDKEHVGENITIGLVLQNDELSFNEIIPIEINTIDALDKINELKLTSLIIDRRKVKAPEIVVTTKEVKQEIIQDLVWQYPIIDRVGEGIDHNQSSIPLRLRITSNVEIDESQIVLKINGKEPIEGVQYYRHNKRFLFVDRANERQYYSYKNIINLVRGENKISVSIKNDDGEENENHFFAYYDPPKNELHVFSIGVDYSNTAYPLQYTTTDAQDISNTFLQQKGALFQQVHQHTLNTIGQTSAQSIARYILSDINDAYSRGEIQNEDMIVLYLSGHGFLDPSDQTYRIAGSDFDDRTILFSSVDYKKDILDQIAKIPCKKLILFDACNSGAISSYQSVSGSKDISLLSDINLGKALERLAQGGDDLFVISSSSADQKSYEDKAWQNGAFTEAFIEALSLVGEHAAADRNSDDVIYISELYNYVRRRVPQLVKEAKDQDQIQVPYMNITEEKDLPLFYMGGL